MAPPAVDDTTAHEADNDATMAAGEGKKSKKAAKKKARLEPEVKKKMEKNSKKKHKTQHQHQHQHQQAEKKAKLGHEVVLVHTADEADEESSPDSVGCREGGGGKNKRRNTAGTGGLYDRVNDWLAVHAPRYYPPPPPQPSQTRTRAQTAGAGADDGYYPVLPWCALDRAVLGVLERKRRVERWLELQADFYNATGRMVDIEVLKAQVEEQERAGRE